MNEIFPIALLSIGILQNSIKKGRFTCNKFLFNVYLYIFLTFLLVSLSVKKMSTLNIQKFSFFGLFFLSLGLLITTMTLPPRYLFIKHLIWFLWILTISYTLFPLYMINHKLFEIVKLQTFIILCFFTALTFWKPHLVSLTWGSTLSVLLLGLIIVRFIMFFFPRQRRINYALSYFSLVLFSIFMLYDTKKLIKKAKQCVKADYINDSLGVVLDSLNIFSNLFHLGE